MTYRIKMLIAQRTESYPGEYGPELVAAVDEFTDDVNPDWFTEASAKGLASWGDDIESHAVFEVTLPMEQIMAVLRPSGDVAAERLRSLGDPEAASDAISVLATVANDDSSAAAQAAQDVLDRLGASRTPDGTYRT